MPFFKLLLLSVFIFVCNLTYAATFTVSSNANAGPGTLRQALLDASANGTAVTDFINFNLPGNTQAAITIILKTQLPNVTANVVIDGTTQPGPSLGLSNTKVIITVATPAQNFNAFNVSSLVSPNDAVEFYGLYIKDFSPSASGFGSAIVTSANCKLVIGAPGKGNVISGNWFAIQGYLQNAKIQSNLIGLLPDGESPMPNWSILYSGADYDNLLIGGDDLTYSNIIVNGYDNGINFGGVSGSVLTKTVTIKNNYFGTDIKGVKVLYTGNSSFIGVNDNYSTLIITANVFTASQLAISALNQAVIIVKGNYFGTDKTQTYSLGSGATAIDENTAINATIGGVNDADQNVFTNYNNPILSQNRSITNVIKNKFYCNSQVTISDSGSNYVRIIQLRDNYVSGDAPPGATVQLYYTTLNCANCNPETWFATVIANSNGVWEYSGDTKKNVMASSTVNNNTFGFAPLSIDSADVTVNNIDCHHPGSIELNEKRTGRFQFIWKNSKGVIINNTQKADNLLPGNYTLEINEGGACPAATGSFTIIDLTPHVFASTFQLNCGNPTAYFTTYPSTGPNITITNYYWKDDKGNVLSTANTIKDLGPGNYYLYITDSNGCNSDTALIQVIAAIDVPVIDDSNVTVNNENCSRSDGSITGITISKAGKANYGWKKADGSKSYNNQLDLVNVPAGQYYFFVFYSFSCLPINSQTFTVTLQNEITMDETAAMVTTNCKNNNGSIKGIIDSGVTTYQWFDDKSIVAGTQPDLINAAPGDYFLIASNSKCSKQSKVYTIPNLEAIKNSLKIPNTFTPNGDGINDLWVIGGIEQEPNVNVQLFNRNGQRVFESKGYAQPFNGKTNNTPLPVGVYYYIINLNSGCSLLSGSLTLLR